MPVHPEAVDGDSQALRWCFPPSTLAMVGVPASVPESLAELLEDGTVESLYAEPAAVVTRLGGARTWREHGDRVRTAVQIALRSPEDWVPREGTGSADEVLRACVRQVIDGDAGDYIRSHGGQVEVLTVRDGEVALRLSGACSHCPASDITLAERLETGIRDLFPALRRLTAHPDPEAGTGRRLLRLLPTRGR